MLNEGGAQLQTIEVNDFSGGITDNILGAPKEKCQRSDNFFLQKVGGKARLITRPAMRSFVSSRIPTNLRAQSLFDIETKPFQISNKKLFQNDTTSFTEILGPTNSAFNLGLTTSNYSVSVWQKHAIIANDAFAKIIRLYNNATAWTVNNLGVPALSGPPAFLASAVGATFTYGYAFHFYTEYNNQNVTFAEQGAITFASATSNIALGGANTMTITPPVGWTITNGVTDNYLLANLKVKIWRTTSGGTSYYSHSTVNYNSGAVVDSTTDATISASSNAVLYTNGADDVPIHSQPPEAKVSHVVNDILCLGYVKEGAEFLPNRARFSNRFALWSCPTVFYEDFDEEIIGINSFNIYPIYFCKNKIYRIEGYYLPDGSAGVTKKLISSTAGCLSNRSIIKTDTGLFFCGNDGFYFTNGYEVTRISNDLLTSYLSLTDTAAKRAAITGTYYPRLQAVLWAVQSDATSVDNDALYMTFLQAGVSDSMPFSTWSGGDVRANFLPSSIHHTDGVLYMADYNGYVFKFDHSLFSDSRIEVGVAVGSWINKTIVYDYRSVAYDFGTSSFKKWVPRMLVSFENTSSVSLQIKSNNDNGGNFKDLKEIDSRGYVAWGDYTLTWGDANFQWNYSAIITIKRSFPKDGLRAFYKQIVLTNSYATVEVSTATENAVMAGAANTATLPALAWPPDVLDYYLSTDFDSYSTQFKITARTATQLTLTDADNVLPTGTYAWKIQGYRRDEVVRIIAYAVDYAVAAQSGDVHRA